MKILQKWRAFSKKNPGKESNGKNEEAPKEVPKPKDPVVDILDKSDEGSSEQSIRQKRMKNIKKNIEANKQIDNGNGAVGGSDKKKKTAINYDGSDSDLDDEADGDMPGNEAGLYSARDQRNAQMQSNGRKMSKKGRK